MHRNPTLELLPFDPKLEKTLRKLKKSKVEQVRIEDIQIDRYSEDNSNKNDLPEIREPTLGDHWKPMLNDNYSGIRQPFINANNFKFKPILISMVQQQ